MLKNYVKLIVALVFASNVMAQNVPSYLPTNGLVGWWPFNGNANDESGNGNNGTVNGATLTADRNGIVNKSYSFYNNNDYIEIPTSNGAFDSQDFTQSLWFKSSESSSGLGGPNVNPAIISRLNVGGPIGDNTTNNIWHVTEIGGNIFHCIGVYSTVSVITGLINTGWHNIIYTKNGENYSAYINGKLWKNGKVNGSIIFNNYPIRLGRSQHTYWRDFSGELDDIAIYNRALTEQEITALYSGTPATGLASTKVFVDAPATVNQHQEVELSISSEELNTADNVIAYQTDFSYDTTRFTYVGSNLVGTLNPAGTVGINKSKNGLLQVGYMSQTALSGAGSLVKLKFKANNTTGQGVFGLANFMYNNTTISSLKSDTVTTLDVTPPTAKITYTQNPVRKGDSLLITVNFNEKMALSPVPQLNLTGQNTLSNTNLTKVNDTIYTFWWVAEKGNGAVTVTLATGKDVGGNAIVATPTQNASFTVLPTLFGDVDTNSFVRAYDAALALQYSVGLNPLPTMDPLPWSNWRIAVANVDTVGNVTANDASLILQKSIGQIATFPADAKKRGGETPTANVTVALEGNQLVFRATGSLYAFNVYMKDNFNVFGQPEVKDKNAMVASNITTTTYKVGLAATTPLVENEPFLVIPILTNENLQGTLDIVANAQEKSLSYGKAAGLTTINQEVVIVYPNPTKDVVTITNAQGKTLRIVDVQGKEVYNQKVTTSSMEVSMKALGAKGMYLVHIVDANNESIQKQQIILE